MEKRRSTGYSGRERKTYGQGVNIDDKEMQGHGEGHGGQQPAIAPWGHANQRLVLRQARKRQEGLYGCISNSITFHMIQYSEMIT